MGDPAAGDLRGGCRANRRRLYALSTRRLAVRHVRGRAAADPADRHPAHVHLLRAAARDHRRDRAAAALRARPRGDRRDARAPAGRDQGHRRRARSSASARPSTSTPAWSSARTASAAWSSTRARPSTPSTGPTPSSPATSGTATCRCRSRSSTARRARSRSSATAPARPSAPTRATSRETAIDGVEIDPELTEMGREYFEPARPPRPAALPRGRAAVPAPHRPPLRRDLRRRLPAAVHPVLSDDAGVLRPRPRAPEPGRHRDRQRRPPGGLARAGEGARRGRALRVPARPRVRHHGDQHAARRRRPAAGRRARGGAAERAGELRPLFDAPRAGCARRSSATRPSPTTARRSSG